MRSSLNPLDVLHASLVAAGVGADTPLVVAFSGGLDSTALLFAACQLQADFGYHLQAVHVHHGLQPAADRWADHCAAVAASLAIPFICIRVQVPVGAGQGVEAAARKARYAALATVAARHVLLAHHADDQAETVLLALLRGAGPAGLSAMGDVSVPPSHPLRDTLLRPWLSLSREVLADWAQAQGLHWVEDPSNQHSRFDRNFLRLEVLPLLARRFAGWRQSLARSAAWNAEAQHLLGELADLDRASFQAGSAWPDDPACLPGRVGEWRALAPARQRNLLRCLIQRRGLPLPPALRLQAWLDQLDAADDRLPLLVWQGCALRRWSGRLWLEMAVPALPPQMPALRWDGVNAAEWSMPDGQVWQVVPWPEAGGSRLLPSASPSHPQPLLTHPLRVDCGPLELRWGGGQGRLQMHVGGPHRDLRKLFQEAGVPPWRRTSLPRLHAGRTLVAVPGIGTAPDWQAEWSAPGWQLTCRAGA